MSRETKKKRTAGSIIRSIILILCIGVFLFSAAQLVMIFVEYKKGSDEYDRVREYVTLPDEKEETAENKDDVQTGEKVPAPPIVDWEGLQAINKDVIGWLRIDGTDINYPIVQGEDNDYYLKYTFERTANSAGAIFMNSSNSRDFQDLNTIIYGHNMKNGSMFGSLAKHFKNGESVPGKYIWICTPEKQYRYRIFSSHVVDAAGEAYTLFSVPDEAFAAYVAKMKAQSLVDFGTEVSGEDRVLTLSTCTGNDTTRFVLQARREGEY